MEKSPQEKTPQPVLQPVEKSPPAFWGHVEKNAQFYTKPSISRNNSISLKSPEVPTIVYKIDKCIQFFKKSPFCYNSM